MRRDEEGTALIEAVWLAILLMVPLVYVVLSVVQVQQGSFGVSAAARAAGRAYAQAPNDSIGRDRATAAARVALADQGITSREAWSITFSCSPKPCHSAGSVETIRIVTRLKLPLMPQALGDEAPSFTLEGIHHAPIGKYQQ